ncbi:MAG: hypothetical protein NTZ83_05815 [Candidatus Pacearchaeota archaeon]|nr:hypothetical protein [Candidatus Pacearchaeota archaeon]
MENKKQNMKKKELDKKVVTVKQAIMELRSSPALIKEMEKVLSC